MAIAPNAISSRAHALLTERGAKNKAPNRTRPRAPWTSGPTSPKTRPCSLASRCYPDRTGRRVGRPPQLAGEGETGIAFGTAADVPAHSSDQRRRSRGVRRPARLVQAIGQWRHRSAGITPAVDAARRSLGKGWVSGQEQSPRSQAARGDSFVRESVRVMRSQFP